MTGAQLEPERHTVVMESPGFLMIAVGVARPEHGIAVARQMVADGVQLIELCGGFGPLWTAKIIEAIDRAVPVGAVGYGPESLDQMYRLFND